MQCNVCRSDLYGKCRGRAGEGRRKGGMKKNRVQWLIY